MSDPCRNCGLTSHANCCARCGALLREADQDYCSEACADDQIREDKISIALEDDRERARSQRRS